MPWFFHHWYPSRANTRFPDLAARKATVASELILLQRRRLDPLLVRYLEACAAAAFSFHEAVRVEPGRGFLLRDLMLESETFVVEHGASRSVHPGDMVFAQIVRIDGLAMLEGCGPVAFQPLEKPGIINLRKTIRGRGDVVGEARLKERSLELIDLYLELAERKLHPAMPELQNTDGAPLEFDEQRGGYYYERNADGGTYELPGLWFNAAELQALLVFDRLLEIQPKLSARIARLKDSSNPWERVRFEVLLEA